MTSFFYITAILLFLAIFAAAIEDKKVPFKDVKIITLRNGDMTHARRIRPRPQIQCVNGDCEKCQFDVAQCTNTGWDGQKTHWKCEATMINECLFGEINIECEGFDKAGDPYILAGSCGLKYTVRIISKANEFFVNLFWFCLICSLLYLIYLFWSKRFYRDSSYRFVPPRNFYSTSPEYSANKGFTTGYVLGLN